MPLQECSREHGPCLEPLLPRPIKLGNDGHWQDEDVEVQHDIQRSADQRPDDAAAAEEAAPSLFIESSIRPYLLAVGGDEVDLDGDVGQKEKDRRNQTDADCNTHVSVHGEDLLEQQEEGHLGEEEAEARQDRSREEDLRLSVSLHQF